jgi:hypothetical protein
MSYSDGDFLDFYSVLLAKWQDSTSIRLCPPPSESFQVIIHRCYDSTLYHILQLLPQREVTSTPFSRAELETQGGCLVARQPTERGSGKCRSQTKARPRVLYKLNTS